MSRSARLEEGAVPRKRYDAIVFGAGPAGAAAALALARKGVSVAVFARPAGSAPAIGESVPPGVKPLLAQLRLWETFRLAGHAESLGTTVTWGDAQAYENDHLFNPYGPGWHLDRARFDAMLLDAARDAGADVLNGTAQACVRDRDRGWLAVSREGRTLAGRWLIDATGRCAWLARRLGARRDRLDGMVGLAGFSTSETLTDRRTLIEAMPDGWRYRAALPAERTVRVFFTDVDLLPKGRADRNAAWREACPGADSSAAEPRVVAAWSGGSAPCAGKGWMAIGDAALAYDPLSGQGICRAFGSALRCAETVSADLLEREDFVRDLIAKVNDERRRYVQTRHGHYQRERRWPERPFWKRRHTTINLKISP